MDEPGLMQAAREVARQIVSGALSPHDGAWKIYQLIWNESTRPEQLVAFIGLWSCLDDELKRPPGSELYSSDAIHGYEEAIRTAAKRLLVRDGSMVGLPAPEKNPAPAINRPTAASRGRSRGGGSSQGPDKVGSMSSLANEVYRLLRSRVPALRPQISYDDLCRLLPSPFDDVGPRDPRLWDALGEIVAGCRRLDLPALAAIVVRAEGGTPGAGYYRVAHPDIAGDPIKEAIAWGQEMQRVVRTKYPPTL